MNADGRPGGEQQQVDAEGATVHERTFSMSHRYTFRYELQLLLERVGFEVVDVYRDYDRNSYDGTGEILVVVQEPVSGLWGAAIADDAAAVMAFIMLSTPAPMSFSVFVTAATGSNLPQL